MALALAARLGGEVVNADSMALYRGFDIGTAKPTPEDMGLVPHHLFDVLEPSDHFDAKAYLTLARPIVASVWERGKVPLVTGGTGLYLRSLTKGLFPGPGRDEAFRRGLRDLEGKGADLHGLLRQRDPVAAARINPADRVRVERALEVLHLTGSSITALQESHALKERPFATLSLVVTLPKEELEARIRERVRRMFELGLVAEVEGLLAKGHDPSLKPFQAIGYKETLAHLRGELGLDELRERVVANTKRLAKVQRTWLRGQLPEGVPIAPDPEEAIPLIGRFLQRGDGA